MQSPRSNSFWIIQNTWFYPYRFAILTTRDQSPCGWSKGNRWSFSAPFAKNPPRPPFGKGGKGGFSKVGDPNDKISPMHCPERMLDNLPANSTHSIPRRPSFRFILYMATLITAHSVIPANAGIQEGTGFRVKPGMTNRKGLMS